MATVVDPLGRPVALLVRIWEGKIIRARPNLAGHLDAVLRAVAEPDHVELDAISHRERFYLRGAGPSRWLLVVVSFEQDPGRIITAMGNRRDPRQWKS